MGLLSDNTLIMIIEEPHRKYWMEIIEPSRALSKGGKIREGKAADWWSNRGIMEDGKWIFCLGFLS